MVKEIERAGIPVVHMCTVTPISMTVGANRIVPTIAIPHPLGNPALSHDEEKALRRKLVSRALEALTTEVEDQTTSGIYTYDWDLRDNAGAPFKSGVYIYRISMSADGGEYESKTGKIVIIRQ